MGAHPNPDWRLALFGRRDLLRLEKAGDQCQILRLPRALPYLRSCRLDLTVFGNLLRDLPRLTLSGADFRA